jgi:hypothetical protein
LLPHYLHSVFLLLFASSLSPFCVSPVICFLMEIMRKQITGETENGDNEEANNRRNREWR